MEYVKEQVMVEGIADRSWQAEALGLNRAEARTEETKRLIRDIKRLTRRKFTAEEKIRIVLEGFRRLRLVRVQWSIRPKPPDSSVPKRSSP